MVCAGNVHASEMRQSEQYVYFETERLMFLGRLLFSSKLLDNSASGSKQIIVKVIEVYESS